MPSEAIRQLVHVDAIVGATIMALSLILYLKTAAPTIYGLDAGEFTVAAYTWGIPHATGYPLFLLLGHLFMTMLPVGDPAYRMTVMTAVFASLVPGTLFFILRALRLERVAAALASGFFGISYFQWSSAVVTKEHSLHDWMLALVILFLVRWQRSDRFGWLAAATFVSALSLANHMSAALYCPILVAFVLARRKLRLGQVPVLGALVLAGLVPYIYLPLAYQAHPAFDIAGIYDVQGVFHGVDLQSPEGLRWMVTGGQFGPLFFGGPADELPRRLLELGYWMWGNFLGVGVVLGIFGMRALIARNRWFFWLAACLAAAHALFFASYEVPDRDSMFVPVYLLWSIPLGFGIRSAVVLFRQRSSIRVGYAALTAGAILAGARSYPLLDHSGDRTARTWATAFLSQLPKDATVLGRWGSAGPLQYMIRVEGVRKDVVVIDRFLMPEGTMVEFVRQHAGDRPIVMDGLDLLPSSGLSSRVESRRLLTPDVANLNREGTEGFAGFLLVPRTQ